MIILTGHTSGIGRAVYQKLSHEFQVKGLSRATGHDLETGVQPFVNDDFDVYINNAYSGFKQTELLYELFKRNKHRPCSIINIGSVSGDGNRDQVNQYAVHKASLEKACNQLQLIDTECKIIHVKLGRVNTPMTEHRKQFPRIDPDYVANTIQWIINQPKDILIKNITIDVMHSRKEMIK